MLGNTGMVAKATKFLYLEDESNVSTKFQLDWPANNRIIAGSLLSHFLRSLFSNFSKCWEIPGMVAKATKFVYLEDES